MIVRTQLNTALRIYLHDLATFYRHFLRAIQIGHRVNTEEKTARI